MMPGTFVRLTIALLTLTAASLASAAPLTIPKNTPYVSLFGSNRDVFLDPRTGHVLYALPVGQNPHDAVLGPHDHRLYSVQMKRMSDNRLLVSDLQSRKTMAGIPIGHMAMHLDFGPAGKILYVAGGNHIVLVNAATRKTIASFPAKMAVAVSVGAHAAFVSDFKGHRIAVINTATHKPEPSIELDGRPLHSVLSSDGRYLYVAVLGGNWFTHFVLHDNGVAFVDVDKRRVVGFVKLGADADDVAVGKHGTVFATDTKDNRVAAIDPRTRKIIWKSQVPHARSIAVDPAEGTVYVASQGTHDLYLLDPANGQVRKKMVLPGQPQRIRFTQRPIRIP